MSSGTTNARVGLSRAVLQVVGRVPSHGGTGATPSERVPSAPPPSRLLALFTMPKAGWSSARFLAGHFGVVPYGGVTGVVTGWASGNHQVISQDIGHRPPAASQPKSNPNRHQVFLGKCTQLDPLHGQLRAGKASVARTWRTRRERRPQSITGKKDAMSSWKTPNTSSFVLPCRKIKLLRRSPAINRLFGWSDWASSGFQLFSCASIDKTVHISSRAKPPSQRKKLSHRRPAARMANPAPTTVGFGDLLD